jgi:hypothetical protein
MRSKTLMSPPGEGERQSRMAAVTWAAHPGTPRASRSWRISCSGARLTFRRADSGITSTTASPSGNGKRAAADRAPEAGTAVGEAGSGAIEEVVVGAVEGAVGEIVGAEGFDAGFGAGDLAADGRRDGEGDGRERGRQPEDGEQGAAARPVSIRKAHREVW